MDLQIGMVESLWLIIVVVFVVLLLNSFRGKRGFGIDFERLRGLEEDLATKTQELDQSRASLEELTAQLDQARLNFEQTQSNLTNYRDQVTQHFAKTAELFNNLTASYRSVYEHLAVSSQMLTDERSAQLAELPLPSSAEEAPASDTAEEPTIEPTEPTATATEEKTEETPATSAAS
jgi:uncharacterized membrane-anchored protein YhcB (DUF1043 family)